VSNSSQATSNNTSFTNPALTSSIQQLHLIADAGEKRDDALEKRVEAIELRIKTVEQRLSAMEAKQGE
jgi:chaperonin cofactor prefoldin